MLQIYLIDLLFVAKVLAFDGDFGFAFLLVCCLSMVFYKPYKVFELPKNCPDEFQTYQNI